jgi:hypothetical protein
MLSRLEQGKIYPFAPKINVFVALRHVQQTIQKVHAVLPIFILKSEVHRSTAVPHAASASIAFLEISFVRFKYLHHVHFVPKRNERKRPYLACHANQLSGRHSP